MTAIASWMIACMFFVFGALAGYAGLLYFLKVSYKQICSHFFKENNFKKTIFSPGEEEGYDRQEAEQLLHRPRKDMHAASELGGK